ncbi:MAG: response regulator [Rhodocyclaceae bacterium]|nr:response regulator [Rhodocyclaceae bacterium]
MPRMNGIEALRLIRAGERGVRDAQIPVVALTANIGPEEKRTLLAQGVDGFLGKPIDEHLLRRSRTHGRPAAGARQGLA